MKRLLTSLFFLSLFQAIAIAQPEWGKALDIHVEGNRLVNDKGEQVVMRGIMDTPSPYFCNYRFTDNHWIDVYRDGDNYIEKCKTYFDKIFTAVTDTAQGSWCNVFRLHLDPCWTDNPNKKNAGFTEKNGKVYDPNGTEVSGEASTYHFDINRLNSYIGKLYLNIAREANNHGMYVIMRPPGVCPSKIKVGDYYQQYLIDVWDVVSKHSYVKKNAGWLSIELANEPIAVLDKNGNRTDQAKRDFFQPIIDKIRENGFTGIIWVPGETWQQEYRSYANYPCKDPLNNMGYAVHFYPGWYSTSDSSHDPQTSINAFQNSIPVVKTHPVMITEVDWSPEDKHVIDHYNEYGQPVYKNYGTWATGSTSKFGLAYKAVLDHFGNVGMTITHTHDYLEIDKYLATGQVLPRWKNDVNKEYMEACSGACFEWYKQYAALPNFAREWNNKEHANDAYLFPISTKGSETSPYFVTPNLNGKGAVSATNKKITTVTGGFAAWLYDKGIDASAAKYLIIQLANPGYEGAELRIHNDTVQNSAYYSYDLTRKSIAVIPLNEAVKTDGTPLDLTHIGMVGFKNNSAANGGITIDKIFFTDALMHTVNVTESQATVTKGDVNGDNEINVFDITTIADHIVNGTAINEDAADMNNDGNVDVFDIVLLSELILNGK